jgi:hypothetical protein
VHGCNHEAMIYEAKTFGAFLRKVAIDYVRYGYYYYSVGRIRGKNLEAFDRKMIKTYDLSFHRTTRSRRRKQGLRVVAYVRFGDRFVLLATEGIHEQVDRWGFKDCRVTPIALSGYAVTVTGTTPVVRLSLKRYRGLRKLASSRVALYEKERLETFLEDISPYEFPAIIRQKQKLVKFINQRRRAAGLKPIYLEIKSSSKMRG